MLRTSDQKTPSPVRDQKTPSPVRDQKTPSPVRDRKTPPPVGDRKTPSPVGDQAAARELDPYECREAAGDPAEPLPLSDLEEVTHWGQLPPRARLSNVALMVIVHTRDGRRVLTFTERPRGVGPPRVGLPAGRVEKNDRSLWAAMAREYREETGGDPLPRLEHVRRFAWRGHTAIFVAETRDRVGTGPPGPGSDGEITGRHLTQVSHLRAAAAGDPRAGFCLRMCARASTLALLDVLGL